MDGGVRACVMTQPDRMYELWHGVDEKVFNPGTNVSEKYEKLSQYSKWDQGKYDS